MKGMYQTEIEIFGINEGIKKLLEIIINYHFENEKRTSKYYFAEGILQIDDTRMKLLDVLKDENLFHVIKQSSSPIIIKLDGPYGEYDYLRELDFFEVLAETIPCARFHGSFIGEGTYSYESVEYQLEDKKLYISKYYVNYEDEDVNAYYLNMIKEKLPYDNFIELLRLNEEDFDEDDYEEFIEGACERESFLFREYAEFMDYFPSLEISESQYRELSDLVAEMGIDFNTFEASGEDGNREKYIYDPINHNYYEEESSIMDEEKKLPGNSYSGIIKADPFSLTVNGVCIDTDSTVDIIKTAGLTGDSFCIDEWEEEHLYDYVINKPVCIQGLQFCVVLSFYIVENESRLASLQLSLNGNYEEKQNWTKLLVFALNLFGRADTESVNEVTFQDGKVELSWDTDPLNPDEEEVVPVIRYADCTEEENW